MRIMNLLIVLLFVVLCESELGYSADSAGNDIGQGLGTGGNAYGFSGSFAGTGGNNVPASFASFIPQFDFSSFFDQLNRQHQAFIEQLQRVPQGVQSGGTQTTGSTTGSFPNRGGFVGGFGGGYGDSDGTSFSFSGPIGGEGAFASGSIGPGGIQQTASVFPENPDAPNVIRRFGGVGNGFGDGMDYKSVFSSSKSVSANVDGRPQTFREASTTINDNGKVTTYTAHNP